ncbi:hypothetical protein EGW08_001623 [Elysia chlorotica]|uniref:Uncharacterized protein n=1 Tax=Elysia chlorotica TaxID=188477 RepID=A0A433UA31_ELYCH|nr:hypothetical protein EGW08_001623 [Elysia chlorotica]
MRKRDASDIDTPATKYLAVYTNREKEGAVNSACSFFLLVASSSLVFQVLVNSQTTPAFVGDYFADPVINFDDWSYLSFPNDTLKQFFECLCEARNSQCRLHAEEDDRLNTYYIFTIYFTVSRVEQINVSDEVVLDLLTQPVFVCQPEDSSYTFLNTINCRRPYKGEEVCDNYDLNCIPMVHECESVCFTVFWFKEDFSWFISYENFDEFPVNDRNCSGNGWKAHTPYASNVTDSPKVEIGRKQHSTNTGGEYEHTTVSRLEEIPEDQSREEKERCPVLFTVVPGATVGGLTVFIIAVVLLRWNARAKRKVSTTIELPPPTSGVTVTMSELPDNENGEHTANESCNTNLGCTVTDEVICHHVSDENLVEFDDNEGYSVIRDVLINGSGMRFTRDERQSQPQPKLPDDGITSLDSVSTTLLQPPTRAITVVEEKVTSTTSATSVPMEAASLDSSTSITPTITVTDATPETKSLHVLATQFSTQTSSTYPVTTTYALQDLRSAAHIPHNTTCTTLTSLDAASTTHTQQNTTSTTLSPQNTTFTAHNHPRYTTSIVYIPHDTASTASWAQVPQSVDSHIPCELPINPHTGTRVLPPRCHKRQVDLDSHEYLAMVNLEPYHHTTHNVTQAKLVRTHAGQLELVSVEEEAPCFTEYYTRLLLIHDREGTLSLLGLLQEQNMDEDSGDSGQVSASGSSEGAAHHAGIPDHPRQLTCPARETGYDSMDKPYLIHYIGSLILENNIDIHPCDYLTVLDDDLRSFVSTTEDISMC